ncbi:MAG: hypothetical protein GX564_04830 [Oligosphaeraceae bacterium]|nr:hypothetical protein [Oligosphaeraceae bacterium]
MRIEDSMAPVLTLDRDRVLGRIKAINGGCLAPPLRGRLDLASDFQALNLPVTRLHDAPLENAGYRLVDVNLIFPFWHLDSNDPRNYYFRDTDYYIKRCLDLGTGINYRLGTSIEQNNLGQLLYALPPEDQDKWIDVCEHIIAHYTEGWGDGFHFDIQYWTIYCEPDLNMGWPPPLTHDDFCQFYIKVSSRLKKRFPQLKFGGPGHGRLDIDPEGKNARFLRACAAAGAPLDFYAWNSYAMSIEYMRRQVDFARQLVNDCGYPGAEIHLSEWHYIPSAFGTCPPERQERYFDYTMKHLEAAAYISGVLTVLQDTALDMANYYTVTATSFGLFTTRRVKTKSYYAMKAFGEIIRYPERLAISSDSDVYALAGRNGAGEIAVLLTVLRMSGGDITLQLDGAVGEVRHYSIDEDNDLTEIPLSRIEPGKIVLKINSKPSVQLLKIAPGGKLQ